MSRIIVCFLIFVVCSVSVASDILVVNEAPIFGCSGVEFTFKVPDYGFVDIEKIVDSTCLRNFTIGDTNNKTGINETGLYFFNESCKAVELAQELQITGFHIQTNFTEVCKQIGVKKEVSQRSYSDQVWHTRDPNDKTCYKFGDLRKAVACQEK